MRNLLYHSRHKKSSKLEHFSAECLNKVMDSHERAAFGAEKVIRTIFILVFIMVVYFFAQEILKHTDGTLITRPEDDAACQNTDAQEVLNNAGVNSLKCK